MTKATNSWKFATWDSLFAFEYNPIFTNGDHVVIHTQLDVFRVVVEFSSSYQF
jgi:hypothetical protein